LNFDGKIATALFGASTPLDSLRELVNSSRESTNSLPKARIFFLDLRKSPEEIGASPGKTRALGRETPISLCEIGGS